MPPKNSQIELIKARIALQRRLEEDLKKQQEDEEKRIAEEKRLAEEQERLEAEQKERDNELERAKQKKNKIADTKRHNLEVIERMRNAGMIMPDGYIATTQISDVMIKPKELEMINITNYVEQQIANYKFRSPIVAVYGD